MKRIKTLLILAFAVTFVFLVSGCGLIGSRSAGVETGTATIGELPQWLTLAHRAEAVEEPEVEEDFEEEGGEEEATEPPSQAATSQPATNQQATTQPAQQTQQSAPATATPKWQQPGTMEYLAKLQLDQKYDEYLRERSGDGNKEKMAKILGDMYIIAKGIGLDLNKEYGMTVTTADQGSGWFQNWNESPSGFGN